MLLARQEQMPEYPGAMNHAAMSSGVFVVHQLQIAYFENISNNTNNPVLFNVQPQASLIMKGCKMTIQQRGICVQRKANLTVRECEFTGLRINTIMGNNAISINARAGPCNIFGCVFTRCGAAVKQRGQHEMRKHACISIEYDRDLADRFPVDDDFYLRCVGNQFVDNLAFPIAEFNVMGQMSPDQYQLRDNVIMGYNEASRFNIENVLECNEMHNPFCT